MSGPIGPDSTPLTSVDELVRYFATGAKPVSAWRIGLEQEKIGVRAGGQPVPFLGDDGIEALLHAFEREGYAGRREGGHLLALERDGERITVEPGGQVELSGPTLSTVSACRDALVRHVGQVTRLGAALGIQFLGVGLRPWGTVDDIAWLPKPRYDVMRDYLPRQGRLGAHMMKRTATVQANFDYDSEATAVDKMRTALGVTSIVTALFAASPISEGEPNGYRSFRAAIWLETDEARCGILPFAFEDGFGFGRYVEWALDVPMFFVVRDGRYGRPDALTFRRFLREGWQGARATVGDWETHLSTLFPEVRLKRYIEVRGADSGPMPMTLGLGALWRGLLDDREARAAAWRLVRAASIDEREALRRAVPREGLAARLGGRPLGELAVELCRIAKDGLSRLPGGAADATLVEPLLERALAGRSPADDMLDDYAATGGDVGKLIARWRLATAT